MVLTALGPYDELMIIPGNFAVPPPPNAQELPKIPKKALRIARIYVSQRTSVYNGRLNWNIAKRLARFDFSAPPTPAGASPPSSLTVKVYPAGTKDGDGVRPFFGCELLPWKWVPSIPVSSRWLPVPTVQALPPIPAAEGFEEAARAEASATNKVDAYDLDPKKEAAVLAGTDTWKAFDISAYAPRVRGCWVSVHAVEDGLEDEEQKAEAKKEAGKYWPQDVKPWGIGAWMEDAEMQITEPVEWKL